MPATPGTARSSGRSVSRASRCRSTPLRLADVSDRPSTGKIVGSERRTVKRVAAGRSGRIVASAPCVACVAATMSCPHAKLSATSAVPRLVVERIWVTPGIWRSAISAGRVTAAAICATSRSPASIAMTTRG